MTEPTLVQPVSAFRKAAVISMLQDLLAEAEADRLTGLTVVMEHPGGSYTYRYTACDNVFALIGSLHHLIYIQNQRLEGNQP